MLLHRRTMRPLKLSLRKLSCGEVEPELTFKHIEILFKPSL